MLHQLRYPHQTVNFASRTLQRNGEIFVVIAGDWAAYRWANDAFADVCSAYRDMDISSAAIFWVIPAEVSGGERQVHKMYRQIEGTTHPTMGLELDLREESISVTPELMVAVIGCEAELLNDEDNFALVTVTAEPQRLPDFNKPVYCARLEIGFERIDGLSDAENRECAARVLVDLMQNGEVKPASAYGVVNGRFYFKIIKK